jgi:hypothetical protein
VGGRTWRRNRRLWAAAALLVAVVAVAAYYGPPWLWSQQSAAWVQAVGSVLAILGGFAVANLQLRHAAAEARRQQAARARVMALLVHKSLEQVADRLKVAGRPFSKERYGLALREHRTTELIEALRQINSGELPPEVVVPFSTLRSNLYAVNARISEVYRSEEPPRNIPESRRRRRVRSSFAIYDHALADYRELCRLVREHFGLTAPEFAEPPELRGFVEEARTEALATEADEEALPISPQSA